MTPRLKTFDSFDSDKRLAQLGWDRATLIEVVRASVTARRSVTDNDPLPTAGFNSYSAGTRRLRELGIKMGYQKETLCGIESVMNPESRTHFVFQNADKGTCLRNEIPKNLNPKGPATESMILAQDELFHPHEVEDFYWFLCTFCDGEEIRCELSRPSSCKNGFFEDFSERIFIFNSDADGDIFSPLKKDGPVNDTYEVDVRKKA